MGAGFLEAVYQERLAGEFWMRAKGAHRAINPLNRREPFVRFVWFVDNPYFFAPSMKPAKRSKR